MMFPSSIHKYTGLPLQGYVGAHFVGFTVCGQDINGRYSNGDTGVKQVLILAG